jgi:hypothetical protein
VAEATREAKLGTGRKDKAKKEVKLPPALEALGRELKERVAKGKMTVGEAKTTWWEAVEKVKSGAKTTHDAAKDKV